MLSKRAGDASPVAHAEAAKSQQHTQAQRVFNLVIAVCIVRGRRRDTGTCNSPAVLALLLFSKKTGFDSQLVPTYRETGKRPPLLAGGFCCCPGALHGCCAAVAQRACCGSQFPAPLFGVGSHFAPLTWDNADFCIYISRVRKRLARTLFAWLHALRSFKVSRSWSMSQSLNR